MSHPDPGVIEQRVAAGKSFTLLHLFEGRPLEADEAEVNRLQFAHLAFLFRLLDEKKISIFGPVTDDPKIRGIIIWNTTDRAIIEKEMQEDVYIRDGYLTYGLTNLFTLPGLSIPA